MNTFQVPWIKKVYNYSANMLVWLLYGIRVKDSQCGFRAYSKKALLTININNNGYEYDSEIIKEISKNHLKFKEIPIRTLYTKHALIKTNKQNFINGVKTFYRLLVSS